MIRRAPISPRRFARRSALRGLLGGSLITLGLPPLEAWMNSTGTGYADGSPFPTRFGLFFWGNGVLPERWVPEGNGPEWAPSEQLAPLAALKEHITVVSGMHVKVPNNYPHLSGPAGLLSGQGQIGDDDDVVGFRSASLDQIIAGEIGGETRFRSIEFGSYPKRGLSFLGQDLRNPPEASPYALFERIFGGSFRLPGDDRDPDPAIGFRRSVLDAVLTQAQQLKSQIGMRDQARLEQHMEGVRALELRLARLAENPPSFESCRLPAVPPMDFPDVGGRPPLREINAAHSELIALALACDQTRVFSNWFTANTNNVLFEGARAGHHQLTHDEPGAQPQVHSIVLQIMECLADSIAALKEIPEGDGTLLDNCAMLATTDCSFGRTHSIQEYPILIAGQAGGALRAGMHYRSSGQENASKIPLTLMRAVGMQPDAYGVDEAYETEGLSAIES